LLFAVALVGCKESTAPVELPPASIAFERIVAGERDLWRVKLDGTDLLKLTADTGEDRWPSLAANSIYYVYFHNAPAPVFAIPTTGGSGVQITTVSAVYEETAISPDGNSLAFTRTGKVFVSDRSGANARRLTTAGAVTVEAAPAWSPDGKSVAYVRLEGQKNALYVMDLATKATRKLSPPTQSPIHPAWMPHGRSILYCTNDDLDPPRKNNAEIYRVDVATGRVTTVIAGGVNTYPVPSPDGRKIAFRKMLDVNSEVFVADADGSNAKNLTDNPAFEGWPAWSPDGRRIAFGANRNSSYQIFVMNADGSGVQLVANTEGRATAPKWSSDGKSIYFTNCWKTGTRSACEIFVAPAP
jgi:TolB protein